MRIFGFLAYIYARIYSAVFYLFPHPGRVAGRHRDPDAIRCDKCGWGGMLRLAVHGYKSNWMGDEVDQCDFCPNCGGEI